MHIYSVGASTAYREGTEGPVQRCRKYRNVRRHTELGCFIKHRLEMKRMTSWNNLLNEAKRKFGSRKELNKGCEANNILEVENRLNLALPRELKNIYLICNGQMENEEGIFEIDSSYGKHSRIRLLSLNEVGYLYKKLHTDEIYSSIFNENLLPIAANSIESPIDVLCYDLDSGELFILWLLVWDLFNPVDWQIEKRKIADNLSDFLTMQSDLFCS